jgi:hypothetical protein
MLLVFLAGCSTTKNLTADSEAFTIRQYDPVEYYLAVSTTVNATRAIHRANDTSPLNTEFWGYVQDMNTASFVLDEYVKNKDDSFKIFPVVDAMRSSVNELLARGTFSSAYAVDKLTDIQVESRILSRTLGSTDRYSMCDGGIKIRANRFTDDYNAKKITPDEYKDLMADLIKLETVDTTSCDFVTRTKFLNDIEFVKSILGAIKL